jgi:hypothetical protein
MRIQQTISVKRKSNNHVGRVISPGHIEGDHDCWVKFNLLTVITVLFFLIIRDHLLTWFASLLLLSIDFSNLVNAMLWFVIYHLTITLLFFTSNYWFMSIAADQVHDVELHVLVYWIFIFRVWLNRSRHDMHELSLHRVKDLFYIWNQFNHEAFVVALTRCQMTFLVVVVFSQMPT